MGSVTACGPVPGAPSSNDVAPKDAVVLAHRRRRPYTSLTSISRFRKVLRTGRRADAGAITVVSAPGVAGTVRIGYVAGRRVGSAVARNRAKRRLRAAVEEVDLEEGADYIVIARAGVLAADFGDLVEWVARGARGGRAEP